MHGLHVELFVAGWLPRTRVLENEGGAAARVSLVTGTVGARYAFALLPFELGPALGVDLGWMGAQGYAVSNPGVGAAAWVAARAGGVAAVSVGVIRFSLRLEAAVPLVRPHFVLLGVGEVHTTGWVTARALLGVELAFPSRNDAVPAM